MMMIIIIIKLETIEYRVGIWQRIVCLMGIKNASALGGSLSRDDVSIKYR